MDLNTRRPSQDSKKYSIQWRIKPWLEKKSNECDRDITCRVRMDDQETREWS